MPLNPSTLSDALKDIMGPHRPKNVLEAAQRWSNAYVNYANSAISPLGGSPQGLSAVQPLLQASLAAAWANPRSPAPTTAAALAAAFTVFWFLPPVVFDGAPPGAVTLVGGTAVLQSGLIATWTSITLGKANADSAASQTASILDVFTRTVIVTHPVVPTPVVGPIS